MNAVDCVAVEILYPTGELGGDECAVEGETLADIQPLGYIGDSTW